MKALLHEIRKCTICADQLPHKPNPIVAFSNSSKLLIIGQAPGRRVHESSVPWDDPSGDQLRKWLNVDKESFYDTEKIALIPMGFCYPGHGKSGDLPPRSECAPAWHQKIMSQLKKVELTLLIGQYAQKYYLGEKFKTNLTDTVKAYEEYLPNLLPMPHPSPRNRIWVRKNEWFEKEIIPFLQEKVALLGI